MNIGNRIISLREQRGWTQKELAKRVNINVSVMNRIEANERPLKDHEVISFANVFDVSADYLLGRSDAVAAQKNMCKEQDTNLSEEQKEVLNFFLNLDHFAFKEKPADMLAALEQFELYYKLYKDQQAKKQL